MAAVTADPAEQLTQQHRTAQVAIAAAAVRQLVPLWRVLDPTDLAGTAGDWVDATVSMIAAMYDRSRKLALDYLGAVRTLDIGLAPQPRVPAARLDERAVRASLMVTGPIAIKQRTRALTLRARQPDAAPETIAAGIDGAARKALVNVAGATMRHTLAGGRDEITSSVKHDPRALGYVRRSDGAPCAFCAMLISRGPVYKTASFDESDPRFVGEGEFKVHDHDGCTLRPVYRGDLRLADVERYARLWETSGAKRLSGRDAVNTFRRAYDAQRGGSPTPPPPGPPSPGPGGHQPPPTPPLPGSTAAPASTPVSAAVTVNGAPSFRSIVEHALDAIADVHGDGNLPPITVSTLPSTARYLGVYRSLGAASLGLEVRQNGSFPVLTTVHEIGHFLDHQALGQGGQWGSSGPALDEVMREANASQAIKDLGTLNLPALAAIMVPGGTPAQLQQQLNALQDHVSYLLQPDEVWARIYAQWIATRGGDAHLLAELNIGRDAAQIGIVRQWADDDFVKIGEAVDRLMRRMHWMV